MRRPAFWIPLLALAVLFFGWQSYKAWTGPVLPGVAPPPGETFAVITSYSIHYTKLYDPLRGLPGGLRALEGLTRHPGAAGARDR